jgi:glycine hydroxymethyltransferase
MDGFFNNQLSITDPEISNAIEKEKIRQLGGLELIASENFTSEDVMKATGSILTNKYAEGYPGKRYYGGCEVVDQIEQIAIDRLKELFKVEYANVQPHSGSQANTAVFDAFLKPGDKILGLDLSHGGHLTHGSNVNFSGKIYSSSFYGVTKEGIFDYSEILRKAKEVMPNLIIVGASAYSRNIDFSKFREIADEVGAFLHADIAHPSGLIAKGFLTDPVPHCHVITSTTHKTLRGPRGGIIMMGKDFDNPFGLKLKNGNLKKMSSILDSAIFPGNQGGPLEHVIAAKGIAFGEALESNFEKYIGQVIMNAKRLSENLINMGYNIVSGGTDNHLILIDLRNKNITGNEAERVLGISNITVNKNMVPYDDQSPFVTSGIRIGTPAITTRGLNEQDMDFVAETINSSIENSEKENLLIDIGKKVESYMMDRPLFNS